MRLITKLKDYHCHAYHGIYPEELANGGSFIVNVEVKQDYQDDVQLNELDSLVNYELIFTIVKEEMSLPRPLIETVAKTILTRIKAQFVSLSEIKIEILKVNPLNQFDNANVAIELIQTF